MLQFGPLAVISAIWYHNDPERGQNQYRVASSVLLHHGIVASPVLHDVDWAMVAVKAGVPDVDVWTDSTREGKLSEMILL